MSVCKECRLTPLADHEVITAANGPMALQMAEALQPQLILLDVMMPDRDGYAVCRRLKASESTRPIPIIFVTARDDMAGEAHGLALGAADYFTKRIRSATAGTLRPTGSWRCSICWSGGWKSWPSPAWLTSCAMPCNTTEFEELLAMLRQQPALQYTAIHCNTLQYTAIHCTN